MAPPLRAACSMSARRGGEWMWAMATAASAVIAVRDVLTARRQRGKQPTGGTYGEKEGEGRAQQEAGSSTRESHSECATEDHPEGEGAPGCGEQTATPPGGGAPAEPEGSGAESRPSAGRTHRRSHRLRQ